MLILFRGFVPLLLSVKGIAQIEDGLLDSGFSSTAFPYKSAASENFAVHIVCSFSYVLPDLFCANSDKGRETVIRIKRLL